MKKMCRKIVEVSYQNSRLNLLFAQLIFAISIHFRLRIKKIWTHHSKQAI